MSIRSTGKELNGRRDEQREREFIIRIFEIDGVLIREPLPSSSFSWFYAVGGINKYYTSPINRQPEANGRSSSSLSAREDVRCLRVKDSEQLPP
jgi:hypothetical protein